jgi:hypothetical protein
MCSVCGCHILLKQFAHTAVCVKVHMPSGGKLKLQGDSFCRRDVEKARVVATTGNRLMLKTKKNREGWSGAHHVSQSQRNTRQIYRH